MAARHQRAPEQHRDPIGEAGVGGHRRDRIVDRHRFAGERGLVDGEVGRRDEAQIRGDRITSLDEHDVACHQILGVDDADMAVAAQAHRPGPECT